MKEMKASVEGYVGKDETDQDLFLLFNQSCNYYVKDDLDLREYMEDLVFATETDANSEHKKSRKVKITMSFKVEDLEKEAQKVKKGC